MTKIDNNRWSGAIVCILILLSFTLGCSQISKFTARRERLRDSSDNSDNRTPYDGVSNGDNKGRNAGSDDGLGEKTNLYINQCHNRYSRRVMDSYRRYESWLKDVEAGPTGKEGIVYGLYDVSGDGKECVEAIEKAKEMQPSLPGAEAAAENYKTALLEAVGQIRGVYGYYNQEDYQDDNFQRGKDAHADLLKAFRNFEQANKSFATEIEKLEDEVTAKQLERFRDDPAKRFEYTVIDFGVKAKKISTVAQRTQYSQITTEQLQPLVDDLEKSLTEMKSVGSKNPMASMYFSACDEFLKASKELMRRVRDKKPFDSFERRQLGTPAGWMVDGSPDKVINKYNDLISRRSFIR